VVGADAIDAVNAKWRVSKKEAGAVDAADLLEAEKRAFDESMVERHPEGASDGGQFAPKDGAGSAASAGGKYGNLNRERPSTRQNFRKPTLLPEDTNEQLVAKLARALPVRVSKIYDMEKPPSVKPAGSHPTATHWRPAKWVSRTPFTTLGGPAATMVWPCSLIGDLPATSTTRKR